ncbi:VOC family protein [Sphingosinicella terrae]|jgi:catechol 2,3-dioxygenase-like lactoylglutathione lyase family enzyme|uniref:VOC family protein n=1 Tax=Sphingosinicella terrae TaxID=2172047 RepID=UPI000E0CEA1E|nr:VOC family protein [Sphingosinicella terrae]
MTARIEHVNVTVRDPERAARLMEQVFGWRIRWHGPARDGGRTIHVGAERDYVALYTGAGADYADADFAKGRPLNHIGVEVESIDVTEERVIAAGLRPFSHGDYEPGRRFYFLDPDGIEYEVVSYAAPGGPSSSR